MRILTTLLFIVSFWEIKAQSGTLFFTQKFNAYQSILPRTKLHLVFNQDKFSPGDTAYFKTYFLKEDLSGVAGKQLIELNLVDSKGEPKLHFSFTVTQGVGQNQMAIPLSLPAGIYLVTAHSSWMKNFNPLPFFKKEITVVSKNVILPEDKPFVVTAVEGGHLIAGIDNHLIIRTRGAGERVKIMDAAGHAIAETSTDINGVGSIAFKPLRKTFYFVHVNDSVTASLPNVEEDGCSLQLIQSSGGDSIKFMVTSPPDSRLRHDELVFIASGKGKIFYATPLIEGATAFTELLVPQKDIPEGIVHVSLLAPGGRLIANRDFYSPGNDAIQVTMETNKKYFQPREKVRIEVSLRDRQGHPLQGEFSVAVVNAALLDTQSQHLMSEDLTIPTDGKKYLIDRTDPAWLTNLNNYLVTVADAVPWREILTSTLKPQFTFSNFLQRSGKAYFAETHLSVPQEAEIMFYLQRSMIRYQTTVEKGKVWLALPDLFGEDELFYFGETFFYIGGVRHGQPIPNLKIEWDDDSVALPSAPASKEKAITDPYAAYANKRRLIDRSYGFYTLPSAASTSTSMERARDFETEVNGADVTIDVQKYILFPTMAELIKEIIPALQHRKSNGKDIVLVSLFESMSELATGDPLYVIDGVATKNTEFFLSLKPADLLTVKIIFNPSKLLRFGLLGKNGIVMVQTKNGDVREPLDDPSKIMVGLNKPVDFKKVDHSIAPNLHKPDFRSTLYWNPMIKTDSNGKASVEFFCSDDIGPFQIRLDGFVNGGRPFSAAEPVEVIVDPRKN